MPNSRLIDLKLPAGLHLTDAFLKKIAAYHPLIEHLSCYKLCRREAVDECKNPFDDFTNLTSLSVKLGISFPWPGYNEADQDYETITNGLLVRIRAIFKNLRIKSLELSGYDFRNHRNEYKGIWSHTERLIPSPVTTPHLIKTLVHLRLHLSLAVRQVEYLLFHCRHLETLWLEEVDDCKEYPPMITSHQQMSPFLWSFTLSFGSDKYWWVSYKLLL